MDQVTCPRSQGQAEEDPDLWLESHLLQTVLPEPRATVGGGQAGEPLPGSCLGISAASFTLDAESSPDLPRGLVQVEQLLPWRVDSSHLAQLDQPTPASHAQNPGSQRNHSWGEGVGHGPRLTSAL